MKIRRILMILCAVLAICTAFSGCSKEKAEEKDGKESSALTNDKSQPENQVEELDISAEEGQPADGFVWEHNYSEITVTGYQGSSNSLVIPAKINGKPVTLIADGAFENFTSLESVEIPSTVKTIGRRAFSGCSSLKIVNLADGVETINEYAFSACPVESLVLPESLNAKSVWNISSCFYNTLKKLSLPQSFTKTMGFGNFQVLEEVTMSDEALKKSVGKVSTEEWTCLESITGPWYNNLFSELEKWEYDGDKVLLSHGTIENNKTFLGCYGDSDDETKTASFDYWYYEDHGYEIIDEVCGTNITPYTESTLNENGEGTETTYYLIRQYNERSGFETDDDEWYRQHFIVVGIAKYTKNISIGVPLNMYSECPLQSVVINGMSYNFIMGTFEEETDYSYNESYAIKEEYETRRYYVGNNPEYEEYVYRY